ncbi:MAG: hypothetical protein ACKO37_10105 [Vampirovibrionales bacterium]
MDSDDKRFVNALVDLAWQVIDTFERRLLLKKQTCVIQKAPKQA